MLSFFKSKPRYVHLEEREYEDEVDLKGAIHSGSKAMIFKAGFKSMLFIICLLISSIVSTWVLFFSVKHDVHRIVQQPFSSANSLEEVWSCQKPRVRREWRVLEESERTEYLEAVKCLLTKPSKLRNSGSLYDDFAWVHKHLTTSTASAHNSASFLPWHRYFIHIYEKSLREECNFDKDLPYWDWSQDASRFYESPVWDPVVGLGGDGSGPESVGNGECVTSGPFADIEVMFYDGEVKPHCLSRGFPGVEEVGELGELIKPEVIEDLLNKKEYDHFALELEKRAHKFLTLTVRGDLSRFTGPNDPVFFLHHVNLDRLWSEWQHGANRDKLIAYRGKAFNDTEVPATLADVLDMGGLARNIRVGDVMDTTSGLFCYRY